MPVYHLKRKEADYDWTPGIYEMIIVARNPEQARQLAEETEHPEPLPPFTAARGTPWLEESLTSCEEIYPDSETRVVTRDYWEY